MDIKNTKPTASDFFRKYANLIIEAEGKDEKDTEATDNNFDKVVAKIARLTNSNNHTDAIILGTMLLGQDKLEKEARQIKIEQDKLGYLSQELSEQRTVIYKKMMDYAMRYRSPKQYSKFHSAF